MRIGVGFNCGVGNFVLFSSVLRALAHHFDTKSDLILDDNWVNGGRYSVELLARYMPFVGKIVGYPSGYRKEDYDHTYMSLHSILISSLYRELYGELPESIPLLPRWHDNNMNELEFYYSEIKEKFGYNGPVFRQYMPMSPYSHPVVSKDKFICVANGWKRSNGTKHTWQRKAYPYFSELIKMISQKYPYISIVSVGGKEDVEGWQEIVAKSSNNFIDLSGKTNVIETAAIVQNSTLVIANDSFVAHCADALDKPGLILFGPTLISKNGPINGTMIPVKTSFSCAPCQGTMTWTLCNGWNRCMDALKPEDVMHEFVCRFDALLK